MVKLAILSAFVLWVTGPRVYMVCGMCVRFQDKSSGLLYGSVAYDGPASVSIPAPPADLLS